MSENKIYFKFDGRTYGGNEGDTIAAALLRNNVKLVGRSFKYHRPRGIYTCGIEEPNALVQIINEHNEPNVRATSASGGAKSVNKTTPTLPPTKDAVAAATSALSAFPCIAMGRPSNVVATAVDAPGMPSIIELIAPPYIAP